MNKVYVLGTVGSEPRLVQKEGSPEHLVFTLKVSHRSKAGGKQEYYPINAWNQAAQWGARQLRQGQQVLVDGYLTQQARPEGVQVQVTASRFYPQAILTEPERPQGGDSDPQPQGEAAAERPEAAPQGEAADLNGGIRQGIERIQETLGTLSGGEKDR